MNIMKTTQNLLLTALMLSSSVVFANQTVQQYKEGDIVYVSDKEFTCSSGPHMISAIQINSNGLFAMADLPRETRYTTSRWTNLETVGSQEISCYRFQVEFARNGGKLKFHVYEVSKPTVSVLSNEDVVPAHHSMKQKVSVQSVGLETHIGNQEIRLHANFEKEIQ